MCAVVSVTYYSTDKSNIMFKRPQIILNLYVSTSHLRSRVSVLTCMGSQHYKLR